MGNRHFNSSRVNLSTKSFMVYLTALNEIVFSIIKAKRMLVLQQRMNYYTITSENYDVHSGHNYHMFKFLNAATTVL